jgi:hypothetical protein
MSNQTRKYYFGSGSISLSGSSALFDGSSAYLDRTFANANGANDWTFSYWQKLSTTGLASMRIFSGGSGGAQYDEVGLDSDNLAFDSAATGTQLDAFKSRDVTAWAHVCWVKEGNNIELFVNGESRGTLSSSATSDGINSANLHEIGKSILGGDFFEGLVTEVHFLDGLVGSPFDFGQFGSNGVWEPKQWVESYDADLGTMTSNEGTQLAFEAGGVDYLFTSTPTSYEVSAIATDGSLTSKQTAATTTARVSTLLQQGGNTYIATKSRNTSGTVKLYKFDTVTETLSEVQSFSTLEGYDIHGFAAGGESYVVVINLKNGSSNHNVNSTVYKLDTVTDSLTQVSTFATNGGYYFDTTEIGGVVYGAVANFTNWNGVGSISGTYNINSRVYTFDTVTETFNSVQTIATNQGFLTTFIEGPTKTYLLYGNSGPDTASIYVWDGASFVSTGQTLGHRAFVERSVLVNDYGDHYVPIGTDRPGEANSLFFINESADLLENVQSLSGASRNTTIATVGSNQYYFSTGLTDGYAYRWLPDRSKLVGDPISVYGANGFHLLPIFPSDGVFDAINLGKDFSGNGNDFNVNGGLTSSFDSPFTNHAVLNSLDPNAGALSNGNLTLASGTAKATINPATGTYDYEKGGVEVTYDADTNGIFDDDLTADTYDFGQNGFTATGADSLISAATLPTPLVANPTSIQGALTFTSTGAAINVPVVDSQGSNVNLSTDGALIVVKRTDASGDWYWIDTVGGAGNYWSSNDTDPQTSDGNLCTAINDGSVSFGTSLPAGNYVLYYFVVTPGVFDIVSVATAGSAISVPHSLGLKPDFIIHADVSNGGVRSIYHSDLGANNRLRLNGNNTSEASTRWNNTEPNATTFDILSGAANNRLYLWSNQAGVTNFGSYTSNNSTDGPVVNTGFSPSIMVFKYDAAGGNGWKIRDAAMQPYNDDADERLLLNTSGANTVSTANLDFLATGAKLRSNNSDVNDSSVTYYYMAWALHSTGGATPATAR